MQMLLLTDSFSPFKKKKKYEEMFLEYHFNSNQWQKSTSYFNY